MMIGFSENWYLLSNWYFFEYDDNNYDYQSEGLSFPTNLWRLTIRNLYIVNLKRLVGKSIKTDDKSKQEIKILTEFQFFKICEKKHFSKEQKIQIDMKNSISSSLTSF